MVNGPVSAQTMLDFGTWRSGYCLECVWAAYKANGAVGDRGYPTAYDAWLYGSGVKHENDSNPPLGVPVYWGVRSGSNAGDVCISWGGGNVVATDGAGIGKIGIMSIAARGQQIGRPYLGWSESICGAKVEFGDPTPHPDDPNLEDIMRDEAFIIQHDGSLYAAGPGIAGGFLYLTPEMYDVATAGYWALSNGKPLFAEMPIFDTKGNGRAFEVLQMIYKTPETAPGKGGPKHDDE